MQYKVCSSCKISKSLDEFNKQSARKDGLNNYCRECSKKNFKSWRPKEKIKVPCGHKYCKHCDRTLEVDKFVPNKDGKDGLYSKCRDCCAKTSKMIRDIPDNRQKLKELNQKYTKLNRDKANVKSAARRAARINATPKVLDKEFEDFVLKEMYNLTVLRETSTNIKWEVDHIVPLNSDFVCGLHYHTNLRVITQYENRLKHNRHWPDMWE